MKCTVRSGEHSFTGDDVINLTIQNHVDQETLTKCLMLYLSTAGLKTRAEKPQ